MHLGACLLVVWAGLCGPAIVLAVDPPISGEVRYVVPADESGVPARFRLPDHTFGFQQKFLDTVSPAISISEVTFPSPVKTPVEENNTVYCEYFRPVDSGKHPGVVVLHILGGDFDLSRLCCRYLASHGVSALFVKMPYYGPRRPADGSARMVSDDPVKTVEGMTQAVLDIRQAAAWLGSREDVDPDQLGITGISLGGITAALAGSAEPRFKKVCPMLAGGDIGVVTWEAPELARVRARWEAQGGTPESLVAHLKEVDPVTYADNLRRRRVLMLNASYDEVIPKSATLSLWRAIGEPEIVWMDAGHYSAIRFLFDALARITQFFQPEPSGKP
jgi:dienelactone hydrolase